MKPIFSRLAVFVALAGGPSFVAASADNAPKLNQPPQIRPEHKDHLDDLEKALKDLQDGQIKAAKSGNASALDLLVSLRLSVVPADDKHAVESLTLDGSLLKKIQAQLVEMKIRQDPGEIKDDEKKKSETVEQNKKAPTLSELKKLMSLRAGGKKPGQDLEADDLRALAGVLDLEKRKLNEGKAGPEEEAAMLRAMALKELHLAEKDSPLAPIKEPKDVLRKIIDEYVKKFPDPQEKDKAQQTKKLLASGLTPEQVAKVLKDMPLSPREWLDVAGHLGERNFRGGGQAFAASVARDVYGGLLAGRERERLTNPGLPSRPPFAAIFPNLGRRVPPAATDAPGKMFPLGQGPAVGAGVGGHGGGSKNGGGFTQPGRSGGNFSGSGFPTKRADLDEDVMVKLRKVKKEGVPTTMLALTFSGHPGSVFHCGGTFVALDPEAEKKAASSQGEGAMCTAKLLSAKHCFENGQLNGITTSANSRVASYRLDFDTGGPSISGGGDSALLTMAVPCGDFASMSIQRPMTTKEFNEKPSFTALMGRNCWVNRKPDQPGTTQGCGIFAEVTKRPGENFVTYNNASKRENGGEATEQGDSGSGLFTPVFNKETGKTDLVVMGAISNGLVGHPLGEGRVGGAGGGEKMLAWLNKALSNGRALSSLPGTFDSSVALRTLPEPDAHD